MDGPPGGRQSERGGQHSVPGDQGLAKGEEGQQRHRPDDADAPDAGEGEQDKEAQHKEGQAVKEFQQREQGDGHRNHEIRESLMSFRKRAIASLASTISVKYRRSGLINHLLFTQDGFADQGFQATSGDQIYRPAEKFG